MRISWLALTVALVGGAVRASEPPGIKDLQSARSFGMGGAFRSLGYGADGVVGNPASLSLYKRYWFELTGAWDIPNKYGYGSTGVSDSSTNLVAAGVAYHFVSLGEGETRRFTHLTTLAMAVPVADMLHFGLAARYHVVSGWGPSNLFTLNAGVAFHPFEYLTLGVSGQNLIDTGSPDTPRFFTGGVSSLLGGIFTPSVEVRADFNSVSPRWAVSAGGEVFIGGFFAVRGGYTWDGIYGNRQLGLGLGIFSSPTGVDIGYRHEFGGTEARLISITVRTQID